MSGTRQISAREASGWLKTQAVHARPNDVIGVAIGFAAGLLVIAQAWLVARIVAAALTGGTLRAALAAEFLALVVVAVGRAALVRVGDRAAFAASAGVRRAVRDRIVGHLAALGPGALAGRTSGDLATVALENVEALDGYFGRYRVQIALSVLVPVAILAAVFPVNAVVGALLAVAGPFIPVFMGLIGAGAAAASRRQFRTLAQMSGYFLDRLRGLSTLRLFGRAEAEVEQVEAAADAFRRRTMEVLRLAFLSSAVLELVASVGVAVVAIYVGTGLLGFVSLGGADELTLAQGLFLLLLAPEFFAPLRQLAAFYHDRASAVGAAERIAPLLALPVPREPDDPPAPSGHELRAEGLRFGWPGRAEPVLDGIDLTVRPGERVGIAGPSGSGKSTLLHLLMGLAVPDAGAVRLGGVDLRALGPAAARRHMAFVGQSPYLFPGTIRENIALGDPGASDPLIRRAAELARVDEFADRLPLGLDTRIGERGQGLSGGQARRVALARALLKDVPVLVLDEPTAHLDAESERLILDALDRLAGTRSLIVATHSPAVLARMDRVLHVETGRLREAAA